MGNLTQKYISIPSHLQMKKKIQLKKCLEDLKTMTLNYHRKM